MTIFYRFRHALQLQYTLGKEVPDLHMKLLKISPALVSQRAMTQGALENDIKMTQTALGHPNNTPLTT